VSEVWIKEKKLIVRIKNGRLRNIKRYLSIFNETKSDDYISHSEVIGGRATGNMRWIKDISTRMKWEFIHYVLNRECDLLEIFSSDDLVGFAVIERNEKTGVAALSDIMIKESHQNKGVGKKALSEIEDFLKKKGTTTLILESGIHNERAHRFFESNGFEKISSSFIKNLT